MSNDRIASDAVRKCIVFPRSMAETVYVSAKESNKTFSDIVRECVAYCIAMAKARKSK